MWFKQKNAPNAILFTESNFIAMPQVVLELRKNAFKEAKISSARSTD